MNPEYIQLKELNTSPTIIKVDNDDQDIHFCAHFTQQQGINWLQMVKTQAVSQNKVDSRSIYQKLKPESKQNMHYNLPKAVSIENERAV